MRPKPPARPSGQQQHFRENSGPEVVEEGLEGGGCLRIPWQHQDFQ